MKRLNDIRSHFQNTAHLLRVGLVSMSAALATFTRRLGRALLLFWTEPNSKNSAVQAERAWLTQVAWFTLIAGAAALAGLLLMRGETPNAVLLAWLLYLGGAAVILIQPRYGLYLTVFLTLVGDAYRTPNYPFDKNFSSPESIFYLHDALIISPLEVYLALLFFVWLARGVATRKLNFYTGPLFGPAVVFAGFILYGLVYGLGVRGGSINIGLWEARPIFYLPALLLLTSNLLEKREHVNHLLWAAMLAIFIEGVIGAIFVIGTLGGDFSQVEQITQHAAAIHMNTLFLFTVAIFLYKAPGIKRLTLPLMIPAVLLTYLATQRRAAFLTLAIAILLTVAILYKENRRAFWLIAPSLALFGLVYIGVFWNSNSALALPAQAVKSVIAASQASYKDSSSNFYRLLENVNISYTIHRNPIKGIGFGNPYYTLVALPDISFFDWWEYFTHNSIFWIWMKTGIGGFLSLIVLVGSAVMVGARALWRMPGGNMSAAAFVATMYIIMHFTFAYADISWDNQSMLYVGVMMGIVNVLERIVAQPVPLPAKRWPWLPEPRPVPGLVEA
jgi:hypothetical protein